MGLAESCVRSGNPQHASPAAGAAAFPALCPDEIAALQGPPVLCRCQRRRHGRREAISLQRAARGGRRALRDASPTAPRGQQSHSYLRCLCIRAWPGSGGGREGTARGARGAPCAPTRRAAFCSVWPSLRAAPRRQTPPGGAQTIGVVGDRFCQGSATDATCPSLETHLPTATARLLSCRSQPQPGHSSSGR